MPHRLFRRPAAVAVPSAIVLAGALAGPLAGSASAQSERQTLSGDDVAIYNVAGRVRLEPGSGSSVTIEVTRGGADARDLRLATSEIRGRNTFRVIYPDNDDIIYRARGGDDGSRGRYSSDLRLNSDGTWGGENRRNWSGRRLRVKSSGSGTEAWADLTIRVPTGKKVSMYLAVGELVTVDVNGDVMLDVGSARVSATGSRGRLNIDAGSGGVEIRDARLSTLDVDNGSGGVALTNVTADTCTVDTGSGGVRGSGAECGTLSIDIGSGSVRIDDVRSSDVSVDAGSGGVTLGMRANPKRVSVDAGSGGVTLTLPSDLSADLDIETGSGGISSEFAVRTSRVERHHLRGTIGDGSARIRVETGSGSVRLLKGVN